MTSYAGGPSRISALLLTVALIAAVPAARAQWSVDPVVNNPICTAPGNQRSPATISDGTGGAILAWMDARNGNLDVYTQRIDATGGIVWAADGVAISSAPSGQEYPVLVSDSAGGAIIAWQDNRPGGSNYDIYARRITSAGVVEWMADGTPVCVLAGIQGKPQIVSDGAGGAIIAWEDGRGTNYDIYAQRIDGSGSVQWTANGVAICAAVSAQRRPMLIADGTGGALVTWYDQRGGDNDIYARRVDAAGVAQWAVDGVAISTETSFQMYPAIASDGSGGAIITWQDFRNGTDYDIYGQRISASGAPQWLAGGVAICVATGAQESPVIVGDQSRGAIITWQDRRFGSTNSDVYAQRVDSLGTGLWALDAVPVSGAANSQDVPAIVGDGAGGAIVTWQDRRLGNSDNYNDIFAQRLDDQGAALWTSNGVAISKAADSQTVPTVVGDGDGGAIIAWEDHRVNPGWDIYAARIPADGSSPLQLSGFTGTVIGPGVVRLDWDTSSEVNNWFFEVQRRMPGDPLFETLPGSFVPGNGTTGVPHAYTFDDSLVAAGQWQYRIRQTDYDFTLHHSGAILVDMTVSNAQDIVPAGIMLSQNSPNPFNPRTTIDYYLPVQARVSLRVFDLQGRTVATLVDGVKPAGHGEVSWDASGMASGTYFYRLQAGATTQTRKLLLVR